MKNLKFDIVPLEAHFISDATEIIVTGHAKNGKEHPRYQTLHIQESLLDSLRPGNFNTFLVALHEKQVIGVGGYGKTQFASDTWVLLLSAVSEKFRNKGVGTSMINARVSQIEQSASQGRILVSTKHPKRFERLNFVLLDEDTINHTFLMMKKINEKSNLNSD